eukprot:COSAG01_NODE_25336_length_748_cov_1.187982_1_plen_229_part_10
MTAELQPLYQKQGKGVPSSRVPTGASLGPKSGWSRVKRALSVAETFAELVSGGSTGGAANGGSSSHRDEGKRLEAGDTLQDVVAEGHVHSVRYSHDMCTLFAATLPMGIQAVDVQTSTITAPAPQNTDGGVIYVDFNTDETRACINDGAYGETPKWEGITGRLKHLMNQDNDRLMGLVERSNAANQRAINDVQAQQSKLHSDLNTRIEQAVNNIQSQQSKLNTQLGDVH